MTDEDLAAAHAELVAILSELDTAQLRQLIRGWIVVATMIDASVGARVAVIAGTDL